MKKTFKIFAAVLAVIMTVLVAFTGCNSTKTTDNSSTTPDGQSGKTLKVGVIQYMSHPSLDNCYAGIKAALTEAILQLISRWVRIPPLTPTAKIMQRIWSLRSTI